MPPFSRALLLVALAVPAGCSSLNPFGNSTPQFPCPEAGIVPEAGRLVVFRPGEGRDVTDVDFEARLPQIAVGCSYDSSGVEVETEVTIFGQRGPANTTRKAQVRYFVAILDPGKAIIAKETFATELEFPPNLNRGQTREELIQRIPLPRGVSGAPYTVVVGFQLTREQLDYNRRQQDTGLRRRGAPIPPVREPDPEPERARPY
jgi:hypothetical protein